MTSSRRLPFQGLERAAYLNLAGAALWLALSLWLAFLAFVSLRDGWGNDMRTCWGAARTLLEGHDPYIAITPYPGLNLAPGQQFHPLPWVLLLFSPLAVIPFQSALRVWAAFNWIFIVASVVLVYPLCELQSRWGRALIAGAVVLMQIRALQSAQLGILIAVAVLLGVLLLRGGRSFLAGVLLSIGIFKPWIAFGPVGAVILIALRRHKPHLLAGLLVGASLVVLGSLILLPTWPLSYPRVDFTQALGYKVGDEFLQLWPLATLFDFTKYILLLPQTPVIVIAQIVLLALATGWCAIAVLLKWSADRVDDRFLVGVGAPVPLLALPYVRYYDYAILACWWILAAPALFTSHSLSVRRRAAAVGLVGLGIVALFGTHPEPWVYQLVLCLCAATLIGLPSPGGVQRNASAQAVEAGL
ncbi:MAG: glycosyltransferase family 87 protein [Anaerolineae bacterium]